VKPPIVSVAALDATVCVTAILGSGCATKPDPREHLPAAIAEAIDLLQDQRYELFFKRYGDPDLVRRSDAEGCIDGSSVAAWAAHFNATKGASLIGEVSWEHMI
jgi:hypothetical protein